MDSTRLFDAYKYFKSLCETNRLAKECKFRPCTCSGIESLQGPLERFRSFGAFFCIDDTNDSALFRGKSGGWYLKRTLTVFLLHRYTFNDEEDRAKWLGVCRDLFLQLMSRMIIDADDLSNELIYLHTENVMSREFGQYFMNGCTGLYFMIDVSEPVNLKYNPEEWLG